MGAEAPLLVWLSVPCAVLPIVAFLSLIWWMDRYDREPLWLVGLAFAWGALGASLTALALTGSLEEPLAAALSASQLQWTKLVVLAPGIEEPAKAVVLLLLFRSVHFDNTTDGFVYGAAVGLGFGMAENLLFFRSAADQGDPILFASIVGLRTLYSTLMHAAASSVIGAALGYSKFRAGRHRWLALGAGLTVALLIHAAWNGLLGAGLDGRLSLGLLDFVLFPIEFAILVGIFQLSLLDEQRIIERELREEIELGLIPSGHLPHLAAYRRRIARGWLPEGMNSVLYVRRTTTLAFRKHQLKETAEPGHYADEITRLRQGIVALLREGGIAPACIPLLPAADLHGLLAVSGDEPT